MENLFRFYLIQKNLSVFKKVVQKKVLYLENLNHG